MPPAALTQFATLARLPDGELDLAEMALLVAAMDEPRLDFEGHLALLDIIARDVAARLGGDHDPLFCVNTLSQHLVDDLGFRGNTQDYYDPRNSFLNEVLERRVGIPITLALVYVEVGRRCDVPLVGVGMPGHFLVRHQAVEDLFCDPFHGGILLSEQECVERFREVTRGAVPWSKRHLAPVSNREFLARVLRNLKGIYLQQADSERAIAAMDYLVALLPGSPAELRDRGVTRYQVPDYAGALADLRAYLSAAPGAADAEAVRDLVTRMEGERPSP